MYIFNPKEDFTLDERIMTSEQLAELQKGEKEFRRDGIVVGKAYALEIRDCNITLHKNYQNVVDELFSAIPGSPEETLLKLHALCRETPISGKEYLITGYAINAIMNYVCEHPDTDKGYLDILREAFDNFAD